MLFFFCNIWFVRYIAEYSIVNVQIIIRIYELYPNAPNCLLIRNIRIDLQISYIFVDL